MAPRVWRNIQCDGSANPRLSGGFETESQAAYDAFGRMHDEQLVVDRSITRQIVEEVSNRDEHLPFSRAEVEERQRLTHLDVEPSIGARGRCHVATGEPVADTVEHGKPG